MFFEVYFDSKGKFRGEEKLKSRWLLKLLEHQKNPSYKPSIDFIREQLQPFAQDLFYIPSNIDYVLPIEIQVKEVANDKYDFLEAVDSIYRAISIKHQEKELLHNTYTQRGQYKRISYKELRESLGCQLHIPVNQLRIMMDVNEAEHSEIEFPIYYEITRNPSAVELDF